MVQYTNCQPPYMETESRQQRLIQKVGERAGLGVIALFAIIFMSFQAPESADSQEIVSPTAQKVEASEQKIAYKIENYPQIGESTPTPTQIATPTPTQKLEPTATPQVTAVAPTTTLTQAPANTPTPTPEPTQEAEPTPQVQADDEEVWERLAACESGGNWSIDTGNGYYGGLQVSQSAWESVGGRGNPAHATREEQIMRGKMLRDARGGYGAWGLCAVNLDLI